MAPTAINQQKFRFYLEGETVKVKAGFGPFCKVDKGIVICHFEIGSGRQLWNKKERVVFFRIGVDRRLNLWHYNGG